MSKKIVGAVLVSASLVTTLSAADVKTFGSVGAIGNFGFGSNNVVTAGVNSNNNGTGKSGQTSVVGLKAHIGVDIRSGVSSFGLGVMAGFAPYGSPFSSVSRNYGSGFYKSPYIDLSDFYYQYGSGNSGFVLGRYNLSEFIKGADWVGGYTQGLGLSFSSSGVGVWFAWINDWLNTGFNSSYDVSNTKSRAGLDLASFAPYNSSWTNWSVGNRDIVTGGLDFDFGDTVSFNPYASYWFRYGNTPLVQTGARMSIKLGNNSFFSTTTLRVLWQNSIRVDNDFGIMLWADEEFLVKDIFKFGGGYMSMGRKGVASLTDRTRFYGQFLTPNTLSYGTFGRGYLYANANIYYGFIGIKAGDEVSFDLLYAGGGYKEFSAVLNWEAYKDSNIAWSIGGGLVTNGLSRGAAQQYNGLVFTKLTF